MELKTIAGNLVFQFHLALKLIHGQRACWASYEEVEERGAGVQGAGVTPVIGQRAGVTTSDWPFLQRSRDVRHDKEYGNTFPHAGTFFCALWGLGLDSVVWMDQMPLCGGQMGGIVTLTLMNGLSPRLPWSLICSRGVCWLCPGSMEATDLIGWAAGGLTRRPFSVF